MAGIFTKDPDADLDYEVNWTAWLGEDELVASSWELVDGDVVIDSSSFTDKVARVWLSGGTASTSAMVTNRITTAGGRTDDRTITINVRER